MMSIPFTERQTCSMLTLHQEVLRHANLAIATMEKVVEDDAP